MDYLSGLNERQRRAVEKIEGPLLVVAGAGAGKTRMIAHRILHLVKSGVDPKKILAITFTNKAAGEMRERIEALLKTDPNLNRPLSFTELPTVGTFHALGVKMLREHGKVLNISPRFSIFDRGDSRKAVKSAMERAGVDPKQFDPSKILRSISSLKGEGETFHSAREVSEGNFWEKLVLSVWEQYEKILNVEKALDFDDLLLSSVEILRKDNDIRLYYQNAWKYLHIDEYQDTNKVQYTLAMLLAEKHKNICVVGDSDQMIYSWRGARIDNILDFEKDFPNAETILLEENYRSTKTILSAANEIIRKNIMRKEKNLFTKNDEGEKLSLYSAYDEQDEAACSVKKVSSLIAAGASPEEIAVLFRANFQTRALEEAFLNENVPYQIIGTRFFERKEVKDVLSFLRAALNPNALSDLSRIANVPPRGIGKVTLLKMFEKKPIVGATGKKVAQLYTILNKINIFALAHKLSETIKYIVKESGMETALKRGDEDDQERLENIKELATLALRYDTLLPENAIEKFLDDAALATDQDELEERTPTVKLMTVHASKGLEFTYVFITGLEEGLFPHTSMFDDDESRDPEEERRLFYVALTRAKKKVFLSYASVRTIFGSRDVRLPSRFLSDIPDNLLQPSDGGERLKTIYLK